MQQGSSVRPGAAQERAAVQAAGHHDGAVPACEPVVRGAGAGAAQHEVPVADHEDAGARQSRRLVLLVNAAFCRFSGQAALRRCSIAFVEVCVRTAAIVHLDRHLHMHKDYH